MLVAGTEAAVAPFTEKGGKRTRASGQTRGICAGNGRPVFMWDVGTQVKAENNLQVYPVVDTYKNKV